jgi:hypothetical protein
MKENCYGYSFEKKVFFLSYKVSENYPSRHLLGGATQTKTGSVIEK